MKTTMLDDYLLQVDGMFENGDYGQGRNLLEKVLEIEPAYGKAHGYLGWLYHARMSDYTMAQKHYKLAIRFAPNASDAYINYIFLLNELNKTAELENVFELALKVEGINQAVLYNEMGRCLEKNGKFKNALAFYKEAMKLELNNELMEMYKANYTRAKEKDSFFKKRFFFF